MEPFPFEDQAQILFHSEEIDFELADQDKYLTWIEEIIQHEEQTYGDINFVFCKDTYLLEKNQTYLNHDTLTDIITFQYSKSPISGDIFISIERVKENAKDRDLPFQKELHRVMAHGILHLCGYGDKKDEEVLIMRAKEETCMAML